MKKKKKIGLSINKEVLEKIDKLTTNKSRLIELILLDYLTKNGIETNDIILWRIKTKFYLTNNKRISYKANDGEILQKI